MSDDTPQQPEVPEQAGSTAPVEPTAPVAPTVPSMPPPPEAPSAPQAPAPSARRAGALFIGIGLAVIFIAAAATAFVLISSHKVSDQLAAKVPADSVFYATFHLDPSATQQSNLEQLAGHFPALKGTTTQKLIGQMLDGSLSSWGLAASDVQPWLGTQMGFDVRFQGSAFTGGSPATAILLDSSDDSAASAALDRMRSSSALSGFHWQQAEHSGVTLWTGTDGSGRTKSYALVDHVAVLADQAGMVESIIDAAKGNVPNLDASKGFQTTMSQLPSDTLADSYVNIGSLVQQLPLGAAALGGSGLGSLQAFQGLGMSLSAEPQGLAFDMRETIDHSLLTDTQKSALAQQPHANATLSWMPANSYGFFAFAGAKQLLQQLTTQLGAASPSGGLSSLGLGPAIDSLTGDMGLVVGPGSTKVPTGALMLGTTNAAAVQGALDKLSTLVLGLASSQSSSASGGGSGTVPPPFFGPTPSPAVPLSFNKQKPPIAPPIPQWQSETYQGVTIKYLALPDTAKNGVEPAYAVANGMAIVALSPDEVKAVMGARSGSNITSDPNYQAALSQVQDRSNPEFFVDLQTITAAVRSNLSPGDQTTFDSTVAPNLAPLKAFVATGHSDSNGSTIHWFLLIR